MNRPGVNFQNPFSLESSTPRPFEFFFYKDKLMKIPLYIIDAFTDRQFSGNPAAVCPLPDWIDDDILQSIASENNLSETAFFVEEREGFRLRWFTPKLEVNLCGHATLATAFVLFEHLKYEGSEIRFETRSGLLTVKKDGDLLVMDFPARRSVLVDAPELLVQGLGKKPSAVFQTMETYMAVYESEADILSVQPDFGLIGKLEMRRVIITAKGSDSDFVSRFFAPKAGVPEDPVTGSAHCTLIPYWAEKLGKTSLYAVQISRRRGELYCRLKDDRVEIGGKAVTFAKGEINI
jgi:PhzF family phenazine biosynthesis protein